MSCKINSQYFLFKYYIIKIPLKNNLWILGYVTVLLKLIYLYYFFLCLSGSWSMGNPSWRPSLHTLPKSTTSTQSSDSPRAGSVTLFVSVSQRLFLLCFDYKFCLFCPPGAGNQWPPACPGNIKERCSAPSGHAPHHLDQHLCDHLLLLACSVIVWLSL